MSWTNSRFGRSSMLNSHSFALSPAGARSRSPCHGSGSCPSREIIATWPPLLRPNSAVVLPVSTLNSAERVRIGAQRREVRSARARLVDVDAVEREVPRPIAGAVHVDAATGVGARHDARLRRHERQRIAAARADDRQRLDGPLIDDAPEVARGAQLHGLGAAHDLDGLCDRPGLERRRSRSSARRCAPRCRWTRTS